MTATLTRTNEFTIRKLDAPLGAEIIGFDFGVRLDDERFALISNAMREHRFLCFRDADVTPAQQIEMSRRFGDLPLHPQIKYRHPAHPEIFLISNLDANGRPTGKNPDPTAAQWHTDGSWRSPRASVTMLYGDVVPQTGGDTLIANTALAYERLSPRKKEEADRLIAVHDLQWSVSTTNPDYALTPAQEKARVAPPQEQPLALRHPDTGVRAIYLGAHAASIVGLPWDEGREVIDEFNALATDPECVYAHRWKSHDLVLWDNRCTLHKSTPYDYATERRIARRTSMYETA
ncbi:MAG TPA: TauD/TfdA family dioxygenase [Ramlibacter sp.]|uniref:TauD/TfdA dioxygenase family protein n=1 Tax=Ramlibacter sp. TaxID=1917967 RepID=UPI002B72C01F|nr:TauD/TfdA family dioxygenase [Ramlibacter sp.]HVZ43540.1 TauD/TfdA family dioxygenase [Ramlibacter sp.]